jgi:hypothetical protein
MTRPRATSAAAAMPPPLNRTSSPSPAAANDDAALDAIAATKAAGAGLPDGRTRRL